MKLLTALVAGAIASAEAWQIHYEQNDAVEVRIAGADDDSDDYEGGGTHPGEMRCDESTADLEKGKEYVLDGDDDSTGKVNFMDLVELSFGGDRSFGSTLRLTNNYKGTHEDTTETFIHANITDKLSFDDTMVPINVHKNGKFVKSPNMWFALVEGACDEAPHDDPEYCPSKAESLAWHNVGKCKNGWLKPKNFRVNLKSAVTASVDTMSCTGQGADDEYPKKSNEIWAEVNTEVVDQPTCAYIFWTDKNEISACHAAEESFLSFSGPGVNTKKIFNKGMNGNTDGVGGNPWLWFHSGGMTTELGRCNELNKAPNDNDPTSVSTLTVGTHSEMPALFAGAAVAALAVGFAVRRRYTRVPATLEERATLVV